MIKPIMILILMFFLFSIVWEFSHSALYDWNKPPIKGNYLKSISSSIIGDVIFLSLIFLIIAIINKNLSWIMDPRAMDFVWVAIFGILFAVLIELRAISESKWSYTAAMPTIFGIGLTPLIQLAITGALSLFLVKKILHYL